MSTITCTATCPYGDCRKTQPIETGQIQQNLDFTDESAEGDLCNDTVETDDIATRCVKCDRRFVASVDLTVDVIEFGIIGEAEKPDPDNIKQG